MSLKIDLETNFAECVIDIGKVTLGAKQRSEMNPQLREKQNEAVLQAVCVLLNSGGGVIKAEIENEEYHYEGYEVGLELPPLFRSYLDEMQQGNLFLIFVKSWNAEASGLRLATLCSNLYQRLETSAEVMESQEALEFLKGKTRPLMNHSNLLSPRGAGVGVQDDGDMRDLATALFNRPQLQYLEKLNFTESMHVEFQMFSTDMLQHIKETLPKYVSAFANTEGGYVFFGVHDETHQVIGCEKDKINPATLLESIDGCIKKLPVHHFCTQSHKIQYDIKFLEVLDKGTLHGYVIAVSVDRFCCAAFARVPSSWQVKGNLVRQLTTKEWAAWMVEADPALSKFNQMVLELSLSSATPRSRTVCTHENLERLQEQQKSYFPVLSDRILYTPRSVYKKLFSQHRGLRELINTEMRSVSQGILIFSQSWAVDLGLQEKEDVICDAVLISQKNTPILYSVFSRWDAGCKGYSMMVACSLKQRLVNTGGYTGRLCITPLVYVLNPDRTVDKPLKQEVRIYPESYYLTTLQQMEALLKSLVVVLRGFRSFLSDELGSEIWSLLTDQQYELFSKNLRETRELFVHGLPGSGKTVVALKIMEKIKNVFHCEQKNILYVCENQPLKRFVSKKNICQAVNRKTFLKSNFDEIQHIIIDEAQNFHAEHGDWYGKAKSITQRNKDYPGILWIFLNYFGINHLSCSGLPPLVAQLPREELSTVVRNSGNIAHYLQEVMQEIRENPPSNIPLGSLVMVKEIKWACGVPGSVVCTEYFDAERMVSYVTETCQGLFKNNYSPRDIAVLFSKANAVERYKSMFVRAMRRRTVSQADEASVPLVQISDASDIQANHIVVDSLHRFLGLERNIVFGIIPWESQPVISHNLRFCLASRARKHLYILKVSI